MTENEHCFFSHMVNGNSNHLIDTNLLVINIQLRLIIYNSKLHVFLLI